MKVGKRGRCRTFSDNQLLEILKNVAAYYDKSSISWSDYKDYREDNDLNLPVPQTFAARFGTWNDALELAGLSVRNAKAVTKWSTERILESLRIAAAHTNSNSLTISEYEKFQSAAKNNGVGSTPSSRWIIISFGTWLGAISQAGLSLKAEQREIIYGEDEVKRHILNAAAGNPSLSVKEYTEYRKENSSAPAPRTLSARHGTWNKAMQVYGLSPNTK
jgi:hypothetical protein